MRKLYRNVKKSNKAHKSLSIQSGMENDYVTSVYHQWVMAEQTKKNRILNDREKRQIFNESVRVWGRK